MKSERLRKLENEYQDLEQWLKLGLVPKKDIEKHKKEMESLKLKVEEEKQRLRYIKESGEETEYTAPKRTPGARQAYPEAHTMPDIDIGEEGMTESGYEAETESFEPDITFSEDTEDSEDKTILEEDEEDEDPFSDKSRWRRGILEDPDVDNW